MGTQGVDGSELAKCSRCGLIAREDGYPLVARLCLGCHCDTIRERSDQIRRSEELGTIPVSDRTMG